MFKYIIAISCVTWPGLLFAQQIDSAISRNQALQEVVVTATRNEQSIKKVPIPVTVIQKAEIQRMGAVLLQQVLVEQTGLMITENHGKGIQMQGLESAYTLILLDGEPLIGRTAGTLDLSRVSVNNIERIEIIKGPVSSLYGSDAMAGVINIITNAKKREGITSFTGRYGSNGTYNVDGSTKVPYKNGMVSLHANYYNTDGYTLGSSTTPTVAPFKALTTQLRWQHDWTERIQTNISGRYFTQKYNTFFDDTKGIVDDEGKENDGNLSFNLRHKVNNNFTHQARIYYSRYHTNENMIYRNSKEVYDASFFTQSYIKPEYQFDWQIRAQHTLTAGAGYVHEGLAATRYDDKMAFNTGYMFVQENWKPNAAWNILLGARFDTHNQYPSQISPKASISYQINERYKVMASAGRGYRAPDFRQLYLHFNNAAVGYTVVGTKLASDIIGEMQAAGQIQAVTYDLSKLKNLDAESSWSYNIGLQANPIKNSNASVNFFYNSVKNLIDTRAVAVKTNNQSVFSYINVNQVTTYGVEVEWKQTISRNWQVAGGYQYLQAIDNDQLKKVKRNEVFTVDPATHETRALSRRDYFGLFNRSHHAANLKLMYVNPALGLDVTARAVYRSKYGFTDLNGNNVPDMENEFVKGYTLLNFSVAKTLWDEKFRVQGAVENILNHTDAQRIAALPGRIYAIALTYTFQHNHNK
ncbi:outer membrane receptor for ferrienterochelin and colicins [Chitinophaga skermanii]|uniref:Outer membrane receptor for ferrienterochelin and colicins n=1 Tax=Chitinophaga skermanii TaxID=331697 RepID=A0A327Q2D2_9BACT|nr:TonB-dependent receptor [Chitinophaga skermanii]RAI97871.1 outer membrane receptor for ferrienterochelin and colicins [Chitinophaga skermanii]